MDNTSWLAAALAATSDTGPLGAAPSGAEEDPMETQPQLFGGRFELPPAAAAGPLTVRDAAPWARCWACGSAVNEAGESFCTDCGAALEPRSYRAFLAPVADPAGPALIDRVSDPAALALLPEIWEQVEQGGQLLTVLVASGRAPLAPPLDETAALTIGAALGELLVSLHAAGIALGPIAPADLEPAGPGLVRLRDAAGLRSVAAADQPAAFAADLVDLAELLELLTATPRTTQRLDEEAADAATAEAAGLAALLRQIRTGALASAAPVAVRLAALRDERTRPTPLFQLAGAFSDVGVVRDHNEDSLLALSLGLDNDGQRQAWGLYVVSDGMGGHAAGELASGLAVRAVADTVLSTYLARAVAAPAPYSEADARDLVRRAVLAANEAVVAESRAQANDMGATLTMALVVGDRAVIGNVGDSRTYLLRDGALRRVSKDHSLVMRLVDLGQISEADIYSHPQRNAVLRSLGDRSELEVDLFSERLRPGDALLLCSDGQWEMTRDAEMARILAAEADPQRASAALVAAANKAGGEDNIAAIVVRLSL